MAFKSLSPRLQAEIGFAVLIVLGCAALLVVAADLPTMSALLPIAMLVCIIVLALMLMASLLTGRVAAPEKLSIERPRRILGAFASIFIYALAVPFVGFYTSTIVMLPTVAWFFGLRSPRALALATVIFVGGVYLIFTVAMGQRFPQEFFLR